MKKILSILYGVDDRYEIVKNTIKVCEPYFDKIHIVNSGPTSFYEKLAGLSLKVEIRQINHYHGDKEFCWRAHYYGLDDGDWLLWLDSDERPSQCFLADLDSIIEECENKQKTNVRIIAYNHYKEADDKIRFDYADLDLYLSENKEYKNSFLFDRFIRISRPFTNPVSVFGDHGFIMSNKNHHGLWIYKPYIMNHYKSKIQFAITCSLTMFFNPLAHFSDQNRINGTINSEEFKIFEEFKSETLIHTQNEFYQKIVIDQDQFVIDKFKKMACSDLFKNSKYLYDGMYNWVVEHNLSFEMPKYYCGKQCCRYKDIQL